MYQVERLPSAIVATVVAVAAAIAITKKHPSGCPLQLSLLYSVAVTAAVVAQAVVRCNCRFYCCSYRSNCHCRIASFRNHVTLKRTRCLGAMDANAAMQTRLASAREILEASVGTAGAAAQSKLQGTTLRKCIRHAMATMTKLQLESKASLWISEVAS